MLRTLVTPSAPIERRTPTGSVRTSGPATAACPLVGHTNGQDPVAVTACHHVSRAGMSEVPAMHWCRDGGPRSPVQSE